MINGYAGLDEPANGYLEDQVPDSWAPIDLGPFLRGEITRPEPSIGLARSDGLRLLYPAREHAVVGEMESGKSWLALACVAAELLAGHHVVYLHFEEADPMDSVERLQLLGVAPAIILANFAFVGPERKGNPDVLDRLLATSPSLVVLDGVNEAMSLHAWGIRDEDGAAAFRRNLVKPCTRAGAAVLSCDHVVKNVEARGRSAIGSVHKGNGLSGTLIMLETAEPFGRGQRGRSHVSITKDRPGHLRRHGKPSKIPGITHMGELVVDDSQTFGPDLTLKFFAPAPERDDLGSTDTVTLADTVHEVIAALPGQAVPSERQLLAAMRTAGHKSRNVAVREALDDLLVTRRVEETLGRHGAKGYKIVQTSSHTPAAEVTP